MQVVKYLILFWKLKLQKGSKGLVSVYKNDSGDENHTLEQDT